VSSSDIRRLGRELFVEVCAQNLEGVVAKHRENSYGTDEPQSWIKIKNVHYRPSIVTAVRRLVASRRTF
jgi:ATP-dependent DNA ligase